MKFTIGNQIFSTKGAAVKAVQKILHENPIGTVLNGNDYTLIRALIDLHPDAEKKLSHGCKAIEIRLNVLDERRSGRGFWIIGGDGVDSDFSIHPPFRTDGQHEKSKYDWAAREVIGELIDRRKDDHFGPGEWAFCEISGEPMRLRDAHVHHSGDWSFKRIYDEWVKCRGNHPTLIEHGPLSLSRMSDQDARDFLQFHNDRAILQVVHVDVHLRIKRKRN